MLKGIMFLLRVVLTLAGALALLYTLSYPDSILPPNPNVEYVEGFTIYDLKPVLWVLPLLFMEIVSSFGPRRNVVWFFSLYTVIIAAVMAWPALQAYAPEWVEPTLPFEDGKLAVGLGYFLVIVFASYLFRRVLLAFLFREPRQEEEDPLALDAAVLDPSKALTVREIAANPIKSSPRFLFGQADQALIDRFFALMDRLNRMKKQKSIALGFAGLALAAWFFLYPQPTPQEALQRDLEAMYEHVALPGGGFRATHRAVHAAYRVMKRISDEELFAGMTLGEARAWLGVSRAPEAYRKQLLDSSDISLPSVDDIFESRTRFFTVQDGRRIAVLYIRTNREGDRINISEVQDAGWNAVMDARRKKFGTDVSTRFFSR